MVYCERQIDLCQVCCSLWSCCYGVSQASKLVRRKALPMEKVDGFNVRCVLNAYIENRLAYGGWRMPAKEEISAHTNLLLFFEINIL